MESTLERNANAFRPKINETSGTDGSSGTVVRHNKGCQCKKSNCLKKYCECFQANIYCTEKCKCKDCKNFEGNPERNRVAQPPKDTATKVEDAVATTAPPTQGSSAGAGIAVDESPLVVLSGAVGRLDATAQAQAHPAPEVTAGPVPVAPPGAFTKLMNRRKGVSALAEHVRTHTHGCRG